MANTKITAANIDSTSTGFTLADLTVDTTTLVVDASNNRVGIGTTSPLRTLHVNSGATNVVARFESTDSRAVAEFKDPSGTAELGNIGNEIYFAPAGVEKIRISEVGNLMVGATSFNTGAFGSTGGINVAHTQPIVLLHETDTDKDGYIGMASSVMFLGTADAIPLRFSTNDTERMRIDSSGNVGIGNSSPTRNLTVGDTASSSAINIKSSATNGYSILAFGDSGDDNYAQIFLDNGTNKLQIQNGGGGAIGNRGITLDSSENVGIGLSNPSDYYNASLAVSLPSEGSFTLASTNTTNWNYILFADGTSGDAAYRGQVAYNHQNDILALASSGYMTFSTGSGRQERMRIASTGNVIFKKGTPIEAESGRVTSLSIGATFVNALNFNTLGGTDASRGFYLVTAMRESASVGTSWVALIGVSTSSASYIYNVIYSNSFVGQMSGSWLQLKNPSGTITGNVTAIPIGITGID